MVQSRLLDVAIGEFGSKGLEGSSTRAIAAAAGTAMSSITYHYGGKEGLYAAAVRHIDERMAEQMAPDLDDVPLPTTPDAARSAVHRLLDRLATKFLDADDAQWSLFIMREQMHPTGAFDHFYDGAMGRMAERLVALIRTATGADEATARITAITSFGQVVVWRVSRALADRLIGMPLDDALCATIRRHIARNTDCILDRLSADGADQQEPQ